MSLYGKALKYTKKDAAVIRKHCHQNEHRCSVDIFEIVGTAVNEIKRIFVNFENEAMFKYRTRINAVTAFWKWFLKCYSEIINNDDLRTCSK